MLLLSLCLYGLLIFLFRSAVLIIIDFLGLKGGAFEVVMAVEMGFVEIIVV